METIVFATDFSDSAESAAQLATGFARRGAARLLMLHVMESLPTQLLEIATDARAVETEIRNNMAGVMGRRVDEARATGLVVDGRIERGEPADMIRAVAKEVDARLIVLGTHGRRAATRLLLGSVAQDCLVDADRPVLVARPHSVSPAMTRWLHGSGVLRVEVGLDRSAASMAALSWLRWLRQLGPVHIGLVHVYFHALEAIARGMRADEAGRPELEAVLTRELWEAAGTFPGHGEVTLSLRPSTASPGEEVIRAATESHADLLVFGTHERKLLQRLWLGSTAELGVRAARVPVVCAPARAS